MIMATIEIPTDNPIEMIWVIRRKIYEETKDMTDEQWLEYVRKGSEEFRSLVAKSRANVRN